MLFTSYSFIAFLALLFTVYYLVPRRFQWMLLLFASYLFYFIAGPTYVIYIFVTTLSTYLVSVKLESLNKAQSAYLAEHKDMSREEKKEYKASVKSKQRKWLAACLLFNFGILAVVKYTNFAIANINAVIGALAAALSYRS
ncbi:MAG TPA: hypothetical protein PKO35_09505 [Candidatus Atribacteria bacterium]|nr:hypothetical protein [Candidatus Atribacteria bacterium]